MRQGGKTGRTATEGPGLHRRDFLRMTGFAIGATATVGCSRGKEREVVPYLVAPEEVVPGRAYWYATVCGACPAGCGALAKALDGRPVKLEGNPGHPISGGGLCAIGQASVLSLYDSQRLRAPLRKRERSDWLSVDTELAAEFDRLASEGGRVRFLTDSTLGPSERAAIERFLSRYSDSRLVSYDPLSLSAIADSHEQTHGRRVLPRYRLERARVIVSIGADFLGGWVSPVEHTRAYQAGRRLDESTKTPFSHHIQLESRMTLTGSNADRRIPIPPGSAAMILAQLADRVARHTGAIPPWSTSPSAPLDGSTIEEIVRRLLGAHDHHALVLCGENDVVAQRLTNYINELLGAYGSGSNMGTIDLHQPSRQRVGSDAELLELWRELQDGTVDALLVRGVNPVFDLPFGEALAPLLDDLGLVVSFADRIDETAQHAHFVCPEPHFLESWGDSEAILGIAALRQPVLRVLGHTRPLLESIATWSGLFASAREQIRAHWRSMVFPRAKGSADFEASWNKALHDGWIDVGADEEQDSRFDAAAVTTPDPSEEAAPGEFIAELTPSSTLFDGRHAHNPWLLELPDPIAKTTWDNFASIAVSTARALGIEDGDEIQIHDDAGTTLSLPALVQPGQHARTVAIPLGWGRAGTERFADVGPQWLEGKPTVDAGGRVGTNAAPLITAHSAGLSFRARRVKIERTGRKRELACTQRHHTLTVPAGLARAGHEKRPIVREMTLENLRHASHAASDHGAHGHPSLYADHPKSPHHWGMVIDLSRCTGCSSCVVSCQAENNIPVVGRDEVSRSREMHWMRIDRYYSGEGENVDAVHMPMLCQHCDNAPCENVCPVQATVQSAEGLNQQVYNRCVGTRYCANNCPYKVRRFNWFDYPREDRLQNLVLNPDVTVRSRGVMEKCSLCVQRIQETKAAAKIGGRAIEDGQIIPACAQSCPAGAIVFGDMNDPKSRLSLLKRDPRHYTVLEELGIKPVVGYLAKVRNRTERAGSNERA